MAPSRSFPVAISLLVPRRRRTDLSSFREPGRLPLTNARDRTAMIRPVHGWLAADAVRYATFVLVWPVLLLLAVTAAAQAPSAARQPVSDPTTDIAAAEVALRDSRIQVRLDAVKALGAVDSA